MGGCAGGCEGVGDWGGLVDGLLVGWGWVVEVKDSSSVSELTWFVDGCASVFPVFPVFPLRILRGGGLKKKSITVDGWFFLPVGFCIGSGVWVDDAADDDADDDADDAVDRSVPSGRGGTFPVTDSLPLV